MILNSGRRTQPDPQSCRVRSLGGRRGGPQKQTTHQETKTKLSSATPNRDKTSHCQRKHRKKHPASNHSGISTSPTACCENLRQQHPNNSKQHGALAKIGNMQAGLETFNQQPCSPEFCHSVTLARVLLFVKAASFFAKKVTAAISFSGRKHIGFLDSKKWSSPVQYVDVCVILPAFCGFMVSGELLKQLGAFGASCRNPKNRIATRSNAWIWRARFWSRLLLK